MRWGLFLICEQPCEKDEKKCDNWIGNTYNSSREMTTITGD